LIRPKASDIILKFFLGKLNLEDPNTMGRP